MLYFSFKIDLTEIQNVYFWILQSLIRIFDTLPDALGENAKLFNGWYNKIWYNDQKLTKHQYFFIYNLVYFIQKSVEQRLNEKQMNHELINWTYW